MPFEVRYHPNCQKDIQKLDPATLKRIQKSIEERLQTAPLEFGKPLRYTAKGLWSLRVGDRRILYKIEGGQVWILKIGHRREVVENRESDTKSVGLSSAKV